MILETKRDPTRTGLQLLLLCLCMFSHHTHAGEMEMRRILVGLKLFPAVVAADDRISEKKDPKGYLQLFILHENNNKLANELAGNLQHIEKIKNIPITVKVHTFNEFLEQKLPPNTAAFIAEEPNSQIDIIIRQGITSTTLLFSPFKGDVEKGVHSGFIVSDRILPQVNITTLNQSGIQLKPFFLRASRHHE